MPDIIHETVEGNGLKLHVARAVSAGNSALQAPGPLLLFLHGFPDYWACWRAQLKHLAPLGHTAVAPDLRGFNLSDKPEAVKQYRSKHLMGDIAALAAR